MLMSSYIFLRLLVNDFNPDPVDPVSGFWPQVHLIFLSYLDFHHILTNIVIEPTCVNDPQVHRFTIVLGHAYPYLF